MAIFHPLPLEDCSRIIAAQNDCILLDSALPSREQPYSFLFASPLKIIATAHLQEVLPLLDEVSRLSKTYWTAGYMTYEAAFGIEPLFLKLIAPHFRSRSDLIRFGVFEKPWIFDHRRGTWNRDLPPVLYSPNRRSSTKRSPQTISIKVSKREFSSAIRRIKNLIAAGDVYQINYTYDLSVKTGLDPWEFYLSLRKKQSVPYSAFIKTPNRQVLSFSPELFYLRRGASITVRPMKGTAPRGRTLQEDSEAAHFLANDAKNRAENVMIVDLERNDLGKICRPGSVVTTNLFEVERHRTILQMTSTVKAKLQRGMHFSDIMKALFPSGSVTGAPKIRAMEIIRFLEKGHRGVYCGAIGFSSPRGRRSVFSVPIRTLQKENSKQSWQYRVGSGIVWDSTAEEEWKECRHKCSFLLEAEPDFDLIESLLYCNKKLLWPKEHEKRIKSSAEYFGFICKSAAWKTVLSEIHQKLSATGGSHKVRITLRKNGLFSWSHDPLPLVAVSDRVAISGVAMDPTNRLLYHKTTFRPWYDDASRIISGKSLFDQIYFNRKGQLTEGSRSNVFVKIKGSLYTPPLYCGLLPGILRGRLLQSNACRERIISKKDLMNADEIYCGNSVRGLVRVSVVSV